MRHLYFSPLFSLLLVLASCEFGPNTGRGFSLPEGSVDAGRTTFVELECNSCHSVGDIERIAGHENVDMTITLGGPVTAVKTYGDLMTSVINPSYKVSPLHGMQANIAKGGESPMSVDYEVMTVQQLVDLVTYLESNYELTPPDRNLYEGYSG